MWNVAYRMSPLPIIIIIIIITDMIFMVLSSWQSHCESSHPVHLMNADSAPKWPPTLRPSQPTWTASPPERNGSYRPHPPSPFIITQPESWYSFYRPAEGGRLSRPRHCSKGVQPVPKAVYGSGCRDKHNCPRWDSNLGLLTPQPDILPLGHCDTAVPMPLNDLESHFSCLKPF